MGLAPATSPSLPSFSQSLCRNDQSLRGLTDKTLFEALVRGAARVGLAVAPESDVLSLDEDSGALLDESVLLRRQDRPAGDLVELKYPPYPGGILL